MKFTVDRDVLAEAVAWTSRAISPRPPIPVLAGVRIAADGDTVTLSSFDYDISARGEFPAAVDEAGDVIVSGRLLKDIAQVLPHKPVQFDLDGSKVSVVCGSSRFTLATMPLDQYPDLPEVPPVTGTVAGAELAVAVGQVISSASKDETLPALTGIKLEIEGSNISLITTDRYRLAVKDISWKPAESDISTSVLIRARSLQDAVKALGTGEVELSFTRDGAVNMVGLTAGGLATTIQLLDGEYPQVRRLFPDETPISAIVKKSDLIDATRRVSLVAERNTSLRMEFTEGQVLLEAGHSEDAQASEVLEAELSGEEITVAFNPAYLLDGLNAIEQDYVHFGFTQSSKPVVFAGVEKPEAEVQEGFRYLLVPKRIAN